MPRGGRPAFWRLCYDLLPPGGHLAAFSSPRTVHRMTCAIEDAGFEIRDSLMWLYGTGFPKSHDVSKAIDKAADFAGGEYLETAPATDAAKQWAGWGSALKPAYEPIVLARKPLDGTLASNALAHGVGGLNIDACRVPLTGGEAPAEREGEASQDKQYGDSRTVSFTQTPGRRLVVSNRRLDTNTYAPGLGGSVSAGETTLGRWPANVLHDGSDEVLSCFPTAPGQQGQTTGKEPSAARFFYSSKASKADRCESKHPTVKPIALMEWLIKLITPPGGTVLDPFAGSGTTGAAARNTGHHAILIEREEQYYADIIRRLG